MTWITLGPKMSINLENVKDTSSVTHLGTVRMFFPFCFFATVSMVAKTDPYQILQHSLEPVWQVGQKYIHNFMFITEVILASFILTCISYKLQHIMSSFHPIYHTSAHYPDGLVLVLYWCLGLDIEIVYCACDMHLLEVSTHNVIVSSHLSYFSTLYGCISAGPV